jgi:hypothetical protein
MKFDHTATFFDYVLIYVFLRANFQEISDGPERNALIDQFPSRQLTVDEDDLFRR